ncbi:hypothetical protein OIU84_015800 [Salix udensis]|uniref:Uncharacterized protein n=1 Tax=Salix udensis TaxID=889485 RepID=A0AAD6NQ16_9ROSI|nr:hypothetical protein OIU84_015800 [Salix udensis]
MKPVRKPVPKFPKQSPDHPPVQKSSSRSKRKVLVRLTTTSSENIVGLPTVWQQQQQKEKEGGAAKVVTSSSENKKDTRIKKQGFSISLTKEEIELDFLKLAGVKPKRKPRKRDKDVQTALDCKFPGLKLQTITYRIQPHLPVIESYCESFPCVLAASLVFFLFKSRTFIPTLLSAMPAQNLIF